MHINMKRFLILLMAIMMVMGIDARTFVLSVGVSRYQDSENNLEQTTKDAKQFKAVMENQTKDITILTSKYANKNNILEKLRAISNRAQKGDQIIVFLSGHGNTGVFVAYDTTLPYQDINDILAKSAASSKICIVDACRAGSVADLKNNGSSYQDPAAANIIYMMGCRADEYSKESPWVGHGFFTQALLKGLRGKADANNDKQITVKELFTYVYNDVQHRTAKMEESQHPQLFGSKNVADAIIMDWR